MTLRVRTRASPRRSARSPVKVAARTEHKRATCLPSCWRSQVCTPQLLMRLLQAPSATGPAPRCEPRPSREEDLDGNWVLLLGHAGLCDVRRGKRAAPTPLNWTLSASVAAMRLPVGCIAARDPCCCCDGRAALAGQAYARRIQRATKRPVKGWGWDPESLPCHVSRALRTRLLAGAPQRHWNWGSTLSPRGSTLRCAVGRDCVGLCGECGTRTRERV